MLVHGLSTLETPHKTDVESAFLLFWLFWFSSRSGLGSSLKFCGSLVAVFVAILHIGAATAASSTT